MDTFSLPNRITSIHNGGRASRGTVVWTGPKGAFSKNFLRLLSLLRQEGVIRGFALKPVYEFKKNAISSKVAQGQPIDATPQRDQLAVYLKSDSVGESVVRAAYLVSKSGRALYSSSTSLWQTQSPAGFVVISTNYGMLTDVEARRYNVGGKILLGVALVLLKKN